MKLFGDLKTAVNKIFQSFDRDEKLTILFSSAKVLLTTNLKILSKEEKNLRV